VPEGCGRRLARPTRGDRCAPRLAGRALRQPRSWLLVGRGRPGERAALKARQLRWIAGLSPVAHRSAIDRWLASPSEPLTEFLDGRVAARELPRRPPGGLGLVGHTHHAALFWSDGLSTHAVIPDPDRPLRPRSCAREHRQPGRGRRRTSAIPCLWRCGAEVRSRGPRIGAPPQESRLAVSGARAATG
jgi:hypothetical protein